MRDLHAVFFCSTSIDAYKSQFGLAVLSSVQAADNVSFSTSKARNTNCSSR